ncbi:MAG: GntP family permease [Lachnospiraceae bacterium]
MLKILPLVIALFLLIFLALKEINVVMLSLLSACVLGILSGSSIDTLLVEQFLPGMSNYIQKFYLLFLFSVIFGQFMQISGFARTIATCITRSFDQRFILLGVVFSCALLVYSGVSALVVVFVMYPIASSVFKEADLPGELIPAAIATGAFTYTTSCFPGSPSISNATAALAYGTDAMAAPVIGIICGIFTMLTTSGYLLYAQKKCLQKEKGPLVTSSDVETPASSSGNGNAQSLLAILPPVSIIVSLNIFHIPLQYVMLIGSLACVIFQPRKIIQSFKTIMNQSVLNSSKSIISTAAVVGFGGVVQASEGFQSILTWSETLQINPYLSLAIITTLLCGFCGSSTGGLAISTAATASHYLAMGLNPDALHRISAIAGNGLDTLPHNGAVNTLLVTCNVSYKEGYKHIFVTTVFLNLVTMMLAVMLANVMY